MPKFYETTYTIKVLSEEPIGEGMELEDVLDEADSGDFVAYVSDPERRTIDGPTCAKLLVEFGSDPGFFNLDEDGVALED